jgi:hypothetical protein
MGNQVDMSCKSRLPCGGDIDALLESHLHEFPRKNIRASRSHDPCYVDLFYPEIVGATLEVPDL